jgi:plasmid stabilization system protein ParE
LQGVRQQARPMHVRFHHAQEMAMPEAWSDKRERQYEHIKDSYEDRGVSEDEAEERAARTVNKERREKGETKKSDD